MLHLLINDLIIYFETHNFVDTREKPGNSFFDK